MGAAWREASSSGRGDAGGYRAKTGKTCLPAGRYSGGYPQRRREDPIPALRRWPRRRSFTRHVLADAAGTLLSIARPYLPLPLASYSTSTSSSASRLGPSIITARVSPSS